MGYINDPCEAPKSPEVVVQTKGNTPKDCARQIVDYLEARGGF